MFVCVCVCVCVCMPQYVTDLIHPHKWVPKYKSVNSRSASLDGPSFVEFKNWLPCLQYPDIVQCIPPTSLRLTSWISFLIAFGQQLKRWLLTLSYLFSVLLSVLMAAYVSAIPPNWFLCNFHVWCFHWTIFFFVKFRFG